MKKLWLQYILITLLVVLVGLGMWWAINSGIKAAQSKQVLRDTAAIQEGFEFFKKDQGRYPSAGEFLDQNVMRVYISDFPPQMFKSELCQENYQYLNTFPESYEFRFCLPAQVKGFSAGWNSVKK